MRPALFVLCAVACARAATIARDVSVIPSGKVLDNEQKLPQEAQIPEDNNTSEQELIQQTIPSDQVSNDLRSQSVGEVHIPVTIVEDPPQPVAPPAVEVNKDKDSENEVKPSTDEDSSDSGEEAETPKPTFIQQSIQTLQALQQAASLTVQNALKPQGDEQVGAGSGSNFLQQSIQNLQNGFQSGIQSINSTIINIFNRNPDSQSDEAASSSQNILTAIQNNFQNSLAQLNQTFQNFIRPSDGSKPPSSPANKKYIAQVETGLKQLNQEFQMGLKSTAEGIQDITSGKQDAPASNTTSFNPANAFQQLITNWQTSFQNNIQNLNSTVFNIFNQGTTQADEGNNRPNIVQQGIQNIQNGFQSFQNIFTGQRPPQAQSDSSTNATRPTNIIVQSLQNLQNLFSGQPGIQQNIQNGIQAIQNGGRPPTPTVAEEPSSARVVPGSVGDKLAEDATDSSRKKGGGYGSGATGDNNDSIDSSRVDPQASAQPEAAPGVQESPEEILIIK